jgi:hypothetical protein
MEKLAAAVGSEAPRTQSWGPNDEMPPEYWQAVLSDPRADARSEPPVPSVPARRLSEIPQHVLRVSCRRCARIVEIQKLDALRLYGPTAVWKDVGQRLLDDTCQQRTVLWRALIAVGWLARWHRNTTPPRYPEDSAVP